MKQIDINLIWNFDDKYDLNNDFYGAFAHYLIIEYNEGSFQIKDPLASKFITDNLDIKCNYVSFDKDPFKRFYISFLEKENQKIINYLSQLKINFAIIDYYENVINFKNFNDYNNYIYFKELIKQELSNKKVAQKLMDRTLKIKKGYKVVKRGSFIELEDINDKSILKIVSSSEYIDMEPGGKYFTNRDKGEYYGYTYVSEFSDIILKTLGCFENDVISVNNYSYKIISVKNKKEL